jgi:hypothetical protein
MITSRRGFMGALAALVVVRPVPAVGMGTRQWVDSGALSPFQRFVEINELNSHRLDALSFALCDLKSEVTVTPTPKVWYRIDPIRGSIRIEEA